MKGRGGGARSINQSDPSTHPSTHTPSQGGYLHIHEQEKISKIKSHVTSQREHEREREREGCGMWWWLCTSCSPPNRIPPPPRHLQVPTYLPTLSMYICTRRGGGRGRGEVGRGLVGHTKTIFYYTPPACIAALTIMIMFCNVPHPFRYPPPPFSPSPSSGPPGRVCSPAAWNVCEWCPISVPSSGRSGMLEAQASPVPLLLS